MQCPRCQSENREGRRFCGECGAALALVCPACSFSNDGGEKFCGGCGAALTPAATPPAPRPAAAPKFGAPQAYTPPHLAERIISSRGALEGERKQVTVLFADLKGSMELLADRDPEEARRLLDPVLERMMEAVHRYEGTVNQVLGDGIMALFGAPLAHEDHAVRACYAALRMLETVREYADDVRRTEGVLVQIRVGLNSGEVVVRSIGSDLRMDYTAVGQTTHLAARMEQLAAPGSVVLAPDTLRLAEGYVQVRALGPMAVRGLAEAVEVYELVGGGTARSRLQATAARGLTKFVGRDAELDTLRRTLEQAGSGHGQVVALVGEPGVGKSRLVWEFSHSHRTQGWLVLESRSVSYGKATSYLPVIDLLKDYCGIEDRDDPRRIREKLTGKLLTLDAALQPTLPALLALLDVPVDDVAWAALDPPQRRQRTLDACKRLLLRESQEQPLLLVFEDLHWIDAETQALLDSLVDSLPTARILLLVNYRPEYDHTWHRKTYYQQLRLDPLPPEGAEELLGALLGDAAELKPLRRVLVERTEGNPFFVEESVRTLVESGVLAGERGSYRLARPFTSAQVPATVQAVLAARIDRLAPEDKRLLQSAAVIGKDVPYALLQAIAELPEAALRQGLARLHAAEFLYETSLFPDLEYTFKHALTHEVAYGSLLQERRRALHARIVEAIEALYPDRLAEQVERLGDHARRGELWEKAARYLGQAGQKANARSANVDAISHLEAGLEALSHLPPSPERDAAAIDLHFGVRGASVAIADRDLQMAHLRAAAALAERLDDPARLGRVTAFIGRQYWLDGDYDNASPLLERALAIATAANEFPLQVTTTLYLGMMHYAAGDYAAAVDALRRLAGWLTGDKAYARFGGAGLPASTGRTYLALALAELGEFRDALDAAQEGLGIAETADYSFSVMSACLGVGWVALSLGEATRAIPLCERGVEIGDTLGVRIWFPAVAAALGYAYALAGRDAEAVPVLEQALAEAESTRSMHDQARRLAWLSEAHRLADRDEADRRCAERSLRLARGYKERGNEAWALRSLGEIAAHASPPEAEQATGYYGEALALAEELGMRPLAAHCHLGLGTLYQRVGREEQARAELNVAAEMYRAMEMTVWLAKVEAALGEIRPA